MPQRSPFLPQFKDLPTALAIFPLPNAVVLPGGFLPLNIFEPRYLKMVQDAMRDSQMIGMVQPKPSSAAQGAELDVYSVGCAGRIFKYQETLDGRIELALVGVSRFRIDHEIEGIGGYRRVVVDWSEYQSDFNIEDNVEPELDQNFRAALRHYMNDQQLNTDWSTLEQLRVGDLCNSILSFLPLTSDDKQLLLETQSLSSRIKAFTAIMLSARDVGEARRH